MRYLKVFLAAMTVMFWAPSVMAATVVGIISERSAAEMAAGAHRFLDHNPDHRVLLRTPDQLATQSDQGSYSWDYSRAEDAPKSCFSNHYEILLLPDSA